MPHMKTLNKGSLARKSFCLGATAFSFSCFRFAVTPAMSTGLLHKAGNFQIRKRLWVFWILNHNERLRWHSSNRIVLLSQHRLLAAGKMAKKLLNFPASLNWGELTRHAYLETAPPTCVSVICVGASWSSLASWMKMYTLFLSVYMSFFGCNYFILVILLHKTWNRFTTENLSRGLHT